MDTAEPFRDRKNLIEKATIIGLYWLQRSQIRLKWYLNVLNL